MMLALMWTALLKNPVIVIVILECLQTIKFYQPSGCGDSSDYFGGSDQILRWMGLGQGSRGASQGWVQTSSIKINVLERCGYGAEIVYPINKSKSTSVGGAFVDDTNMCVCSTKTAILEPNCWKSQKTSHGIEQTT